MLLAVSMLTMSLAGCGNSSSDSAASTTAAASAATEGATVDVNAAADEAAAALADKSPITISMMNRVGASFVAENNKMLEHLTECTGVTLELDLPPVNNYVDRLNLVMSTGDMPDVIYVWDFDAKYKQWAEEGLILPLDELAKNYPNLMENISSDQWDMARVSGAGNQAFAVPRPTPESFWGFVYNNEWFEKLGVDCPATPEEAYEVGKLVATQDPDGNGKNDTFLFSPSHLWSDVWLITAFMPFSLQHVPAYLPDRDGKYKIKEKMDGYMPYLDFMRKCYAEGIVDPEFITNQYGDDLTKCQQQRTAIAHTPDPSYAYTWGIELENKNRFGYSPCLKGENDAKPRNEAATATWGGWMISADVDPEKLPRIMALLDWGNSLEGFITMQLGVQGYSYDSYDVENRSLIATDEQIANRGGMLDAKMCIAAAYQGKGATYGNTQEAADAISTIREDALSKVDQINIPPVRCEEIDTWAGNNPDISAKKETMEVKYVVGEISKEEFEAFLNNEYFPNVAEAEAAYIETMEAYEAANK